MGGVIKQKRMVRNIYYNEKKLLGLKNFVNFVKILCKNCHYVSFIDISKTIYQHIKIDISKHQ